MKALEIKDCRKCPFHQEERVYTADSFEMVFDVKCKKTKRKNNVAGQWETFDKHTILPKWCPLPDMVRE